MTMKKIRVIASTLSFVLTASPLAAQTVTKPSPAPQPVLTTTTTTGTYDRLSVGNRKIARALFEAQKPQTTTTSTHNLSLDQIAAMKQSGHGWGQVFKSMQAKGLVTEKNLGQVVSQYSRHHAAASRADTTTVGHNATTSATVSARGNSGNGNAGGNGGGQGNGKVK